MRGSARFLLIASLVFGAIVGSGCIGEGVDPSTLPDDGVRADYAVFAQRCSKCHSLARPLNAGIQSDAWWELYVTRMRRQPQSDISEHDQAVILRFLHYYTEAQKNRANAAGSSIPETSTEGGAP